ncbi:MAG: YqaJ viral recombinase family protein [Candidatus Cloacimonas acidaminovorans]|nr:YqaJ viral recombinase family protein [Candidatus Cloacimonas acidaminovorans]
MNSKERQNYIGGTDVASIVLPRPKWKTKLALWMEKTGKVIPPDISEKPEIEWGTLLEEVIRKKFIADTGYPVEKPQEPLVHPLYDYMQGHPDGIGVDENGNKFIFEAKTSRYGAGWEDGNIPEEYQLQVAYYMMLADVPYSFIAILIGGNDYRCFKIARDYELEKIIIEKIVDFWENNILKDVAPELTAIDDFNLTLTEQVPDVIEGNHEIDMLVNVYKDLQDKEKDISKEKEDVKLKILEYMGNHEYLKAGRYIVRYQKVKSSTLDTKKLKNELPHIAEKYLRETESFRFTLKEDKNEEY